MIVLHVLVLNIFRGWFQQIRQDSASWGALLLLAGGLITLLILMRVLPYS